MTEKIHVDLSGPPQTMLATLYAKALDADLPHSMLHDRWAKEAVAQIDYDWSKTTITPRNAPSVSMRSAHFDAWLRRFLAAHPRATVLHLGCGLDSRFFRVNPGPEVQWYDVDYPEVMALREQLYPDADRYHLVASSVSDPAWLAHIPGDRPAVMVAEGLTMYLTERDGTGLLRRVVDRCPSGELHFDAFNSLGIRLQWANAVVRRSGSTLRWAINGPSDILGAIPGTRLLDFVPFFESEAYAGMPGVPAIYRTIAGIMNRLPVLRTIAQFHRYAF